VSELHDHAYANMRDLEALQSRERLEALRSPGEPNDWGRTVPGERSERARTGDVPHGVDPYPSAPAPLSTPDREEPHADEADRSLHALAPSRRQLGVVDDATTRGLPLGSGSRDPDELERRRAGQSYYDAGLPWTGEFADLVNEGLVDVS
jgi:hypothetical protein